MISVLFRLKTKKKQKGESVRWPGTGKTEKLNAERKSNGTIFLLLNELLRY